MVLLIEPSFKRTTLLRYRRKKMTEKNSTCLEELNFKEIGINWIGKIDGYSFSIEDKQDSENELIIYIDLTANAKSKLFEFLDECSEASEYGLDKDTLSIIYLEDSENDMSDFLKRLIAKLKEIDAKCVCKYCKQTDNLSFYVNNTTYALLCEKCGAELIEKFEADKKKKNNYARGLFASLLGALIGSTAWIIIGSLGYIASIAGFAISYCAFKGYEIAKGKFNRTGIVLNVVAIIIAFLFAQYAVLFIEFSKEFNTVNPLGFILITPILFSDADFMKALLPDIGLGLLFAFLGTYRMIINNFKSAKNAENLNIEKLDF